MLRDGTVLCKMIQKLVPGSVPKISTRGGKFEHMENINNFLNVCRRVGIPAVDLFQTVDLYENRNIPAVVQCLNALARKCNLQVETSSSSGSSSSSSSVSGKAEAEAELQPNQRQKVSLTLALSLSGALTCCFVYTLLAGSLSLLKRLTFRGGRQFRL